MIESNGPSKGHFYFVGLRPGKERGWKKRVSGWLGGYFSPLAPYPRRGSPEGRGVSKVKGLKGAKWSLRDQTSKKPEKSPIIILSSQHLTNVHFSQKRTNRQKGPFFLSKMVGWYLGT